MTDVVSSTVLAIKWPAGPSTVGLDAEDLHIWSATLDLAPTVLDRLWATLSADERQRAHRFATGELRNRFVAGRGTLRAILAQYLGADPATLPFQYHLHGKPTLPPQLASNDLSFNVTHSQGMALIAVADREVGVDVEGIRPMPNMARLVHRFFAPEEERQWLALSAEARLKGFFLGWTRKEAWLKATGSGLSFPLDQFCVSLDPEQPARLLSVRDDPAEAAAWWLDSCEPAPGYVAAVAMRGQPARVRLWRWIGPGDGTQG